MDASSGIGLMDPVFNLLDKHFIAFSLLLLAIIFHKSISGLLDRATKLFVKAPGGYSGGIDAAPATSEPAEFERTEEAKTAEPDEPEDDEDLQERKEEKRSLWDAFQAAKAGDLDRANEIFEATQRTVEDLDQRHSNEAFFLHMLYTDGGSADALGRLEALHKKSHGDAQIEASTEWLAFCYAAAKDYKKEEATWNEGIAAVANDAAKTSFIEGLAHLYKRMGQTERGIELLELRLKNVVGEKQKASIYGNLASLDKEIGRKNDAAIALEKSLEYAPGDRDKLFSAAYLQSETDLDLLSLANYGTLLQLEANHATALNNLGVLAGKLELDGKKISFYKRAADVGSTLAMANLAYEQINAGLWDDAETGLDEARKMDDPHENIGHAMYRLQSQRDSERNEWSDANKRAAELQRKIREYGEALFDRVDKPNDFDGKWFTQEGEEVTVKTENGQVQGEWTEQRGAFSVSTFKCSIDGIIRNRSVRTTYRCKDTTKRARTILSRPTDKKTNCLSFIGADGETWTFFSIDRSDHLAFELWRSKPSG